MPFKQAIWRVGNKLTPLINSKLPSEGHLEEFIGDDISILEPEWLLIGRQVRTAFGKVIDLLALDEEGSVIVIELKKHQTERAVTAQVLDYGSWVQSLDQEDLTGIYKDYQARYHKGKAALLLEEAFKAKYPGIDFPVIEGTVSTSHQLVVVAAEMDAATERIITYLREVWDIPIRAVFFRVYKDGDSLFLSRHWLKEDEASVKTGGAPAAPKGAWNGVWCMTFGSPAERSWKDAMKWGYVAAGGGPSWGPRLLKLKPQDQLLVWVPDAGYTAVAEVEAEAVPAKEFQVPDEDGNLIPFTAAHVENPNFFNFPDNPEECEYIVKVRWLGSGPVLQDKAFKQDGLFLGLSLPVYRPVKSHWGPTVAAVKKHFNV